MGRPPAAAATGRRPAAPPAFDHHRIRLGSGPLLCLGLVVALLSTVSAHTWLFTKGRATMQASQVKPFRPRATAPAEVRPHPPPPRRRFPGPSLVRAS